MRRIAILAMLALLIASTIGGLVACTRVATQDAEPATAAAPHLFDDLGPLTRPISSRVPEAQRYFDQGMRLMYGFNHQAAGLAFAQASRLDPKCAICSWGEALVLGPNINLPMLPEAVAPAWTALREAQARRAHASEVEQALIDALAQRYAESARADRAPLDLAYANAMRDVVARFPDDLDAATLFAESLMDLMPWAYWDRQRQPNTYTPELMHTLESVLARDPQHIGAIHYYIHATEGSPTPQSAERYADVLASLAPGAGHLVHMPAHTYIRVGRYHDATLNNLKATDADAHFLQFCRGSNGMYPLGYVPHNWHFAAMTAALHGSRTLAIEAAEQAARRADQEQLQTLGFMQQFVVAPLFAQVRFGQWDAILAPADAPAALPYPRGIWHFARGVALLRHGKPANAQRELRALQKLAADPALQELVLWDINRADRVLGVAVAMLRGELALARGQRQTGIASLRAAIAAEDQLNYNEPPDWPLPVRPYLGAALLDAKRPKEAAQVYAQDLIKYPENGWSLYGLTRAQRALKQGSAAADSERRYAAAWQWADVELAASRF